MSNMSYCRFRNTAGDLADCYANIDEQPASDEEVKARRRLIKLCVLIADDYRHEVEE